MSYKIFKVTVEEHIATVCFNRPDKANALPQEGWEELQAIFESLDQNEEVRAIILMGEGKHFCAGIDLSLLMSIQQKMQLECEGRKREQLRLFIKRLQAPITAIELCRKPVLAAIHGGCIGGGIDIISACDMRYCTDDAYFTIKEIDMGMVADLGTLQRLPKIIPAGIMNEMAFTGRNVEGQEAQGIGLCNWSFDSKDEMMDAVTSIAKTIASKSPLAIRGTKEVLRYTRDHSVADGLEYIANWNAAMLLSKDLNEAFMAKMEKRAASFDN